MLDPNSVFCLPSSVFWHGGAKRDRTADLLRAKQALSQLSYGPVPDDWEQIIRIASRWTIKINSSSLLDPNSVFCLSFSVFWMVGLSRLELPTSPLSGVRSNQLSYRPNTFRRILNAQNRKWWQFQPAELQNHIWKHKTKVQKQYWIKTIKLAWFKRCLLSSVLCLLN